MPKNSSTLTKYGFTRAGRWTLTPISKTGVDYQLMTLQKERVIYCFTVDSSVMYVGCCASMVTALKDRMRRYKAGQGSGSNVRVANAILKSLQSGKEVDIYAWRPPLPEQHKGLQCDPVVGYERALIKALSPEWNQARESPVGRCSEVRIPCGSRNPTSSVSLVGGRRPRLPQVGSLISNSSGPNKFEPATRPR